MPSPSRYVPLRYTLVISTLTIVIPILILLGIVTYIDARSDLLENNLLRQNQTESGIIQSLQLVDNGYQMLDKSLEEKMESAAEVFRQRYVQAGSPDNFDLQGLKRALGGKIDLYIIDSNGVIKYSTYPPDLGLDFKQFPDLYKELVKMRNGQGFYPTPIKSEIKTGMLRKFAYMAVPDHKYLLDLGLAADDFKDSVAQLDYIKIANELKKLNPALDRITIYDQYGYVYGSPDQKVSDAVKNRVINVWKTQKTKEVQTDRGYTRYIYVEMKDKKLGIDNSKVVELAYNKEQISSALTKKAIYTFLIIVLGSILCIIFIMVLSARITNPIKDITLAIEMLAQGDLTRRISVNTNNELRRLQQSINTMTENMVVLIKRLRESAQTTASSAVQLSSSSGENCQSIEQVAALTSDIAGSMAVQSNKILESNKHLEKLNNGMKNIRQNIHHVSDLAGNIIDRSQDGLGYISNTITQIQNIKGSSQEVHTVISELEKSSSEIGNITSTISAIADQTNLLALNAAIEAARAGSAGLGFAVVADEVRKLAEESTKSARIIYDMITKNQENTKLAVEAIQKGMKSVLKGEEIAQKAGTAFKSITEMIEDTAKNIALISRTSDDLDENRVIIVQAISNLLNISKQIVDETASVAASTQEQTAAMDDINKSAQHLSALSDELVREIQQFKIS